jgi:hypothetical protein
MPLYFLPAQNTANQESSAETHYDHLSSLPTSSERQAYLKSLPPSVFPHLALFLKIKREEDTLSFPKDIEVELEERNPVRMVQSFRVLFFQDWAGAKSSRREGGAGAEEGGGGGKGVRTGQLTVWDVDSWEGEDEGDGLREGRRYIVRFPSSFIPSSSSPSLVSPAAILYQNGGG